MSPAKPKPQGGIKLDERAVLDGAFRTGVAKDRLLVGPSALLDAPRLLVPIDVRALVVTSEAASFAPIARELPDAATDRTLPPVPAPFAPLVARAAGIHLHFAMPDALTRGDAGSARTQARAGEGMTLPRLPDRWVVVRLAHGTPAARAWVLEADRAVHHDLAGFRETGDRTPAPGRRYIPPDRLDAMAGGDAAWAATYDAVVDRFAFHDDLRDVLGTRVVSYLVAGYWSHATYDPLGAAATTAALASRLQELAWGVAGEHARARTLLHGTVFGVRTDGAGADAMPSPKALALGAGATGTSALAALAARGGDDAASVERLLYAFSSGLLPVIDGDGGAVLVDEQRHAAAFVAKSGGQRAVPDRVARDAAQTSPPKPKPLSARLEKRHPGLPRKLQRKPVPDRVYGEVPASLPRWYVPADPVFVIRGAARSLRAGGDGRFDERGLLACRFVDEVIAGYDGVLDGHDLPPALASLGSSVIPREIDVLVREAVLTDPYRTAELAGYARAARRVPELAAVNRLRAEMWIRHPAIAASMPSEAVVRDALREASIVRGDDASPVATGLWSQPWIPLFCDVEAEVRTRAGTTGFALGAVDYEPSADTDDSPATGTRSHVRRHLLTPQAGRTLAGQMRLWLEEEQRRDASGQGQLSPASQDDLEQLARDIESLDVLTGSLRGLRASILGLDADATEVGFVDPDGRRLAPPAAEGEPELVASWEIRIRRMRLVDAFGRTLDVPDEVCRSLATATTHAPVGAAEGTLLVPPRIARPSRLLLRFVDARAPAGARDAEDARIDQEHPASAPSPIAGWLLPDHVDEAIECFDSSGQPLGQVMHDPVTGAVTWEPAPHRDGGLGSAPEDGGDPAASHVARFAAGVVRADAAARNATSAAPPSESALSALLRAIDTTLWTTDPFGTLGTAAVAGLVGRPIAVVTATLELAVASDLGELSFSDEAAREARARAFRELAAHRIAVRIGELTRSDDTVLAVAIEDAYDQLFVVSPEILSQAFDGGPRVGQLGGFGRGSQTAPEHRAIDHPYLAQRSSIEIRPNLPIRLTLLMHPGGKVHATVGLVPRKALTLPREWCHDALQRLSPSFRVGPVLVDPSVVRMPRVTGFGKRQVLTRREGLGWRDDPIEAATQTAFLPEAPAGLVEGWIRVVPDDDEEAS